MTSLAVAPLLLIAAVVVNQVGDSMGADGLIDRAVIGWFIEVPLVLLSPGAAALTWQATGRRQLASRLIAALSLAIGIGVETLLVLTITQIGCAPVDDPLQVVAPAVPTAFAAGAAFGLAGIAAMVSVGVGGRSWVVAIRSLIAGGVGLAAFAAAAIFIFVATFPGVTCAIPQ